MIFRRVAEQVARTLRDRITGGPTQTPTAAETWSQTTDAPDAPVVKTPRPETVPDPEPQTEKPQAEVVQVEAVPGPGALTEPEAVTEPEAAPAVYRSLFPDVELPNVAVHEYVLAQAAERRDNVALIDGISGKSISYGQLDEMVRRLATGFATLGVTKGDVIALFSPNTILFPVVFFAALKAGATVTTVNALYTPEDVAKQLADSKARFLVTVSAFLDRAIDATAQQPVDEIFVCDAAEGCRSVTDLMGLEGAEPQVTFDPAEDIAVLPYSSGTTGMAKGVMLTHRNLVANMAQADSVLPTDEDQRLIAVLPFFHIYGMTVLMNHALSRGATVVTLPKFDLEQFLDALATHEVTRAFVAPPVVLALAKHPLVDKHDLSHLQLVFSGAAPLDGELAQAAGKRLGVPVAQGYGMTELSPISHAVPATETNPAPGSVGKVIANTECRLVDPESGKDVGTGEVGELWVRGPQVMKGYLGRAEATAEMITADGWLRTGDMATVDANGDWYIVDRLKELIKYKGYQVPPAELEAVLLTHPAIADAAVIGVRDAEGEEIPKAFVVLAAGQNLSGDEVIEYVAAKVAPHKKVRQVEFIEAIPKAASGKILRKDLRARQG